MAMMFEERKQRQEDKERQEKKQEEDKKEAAKQRLEYKEEEKKKEGKRQQEKEEILAKMDESISKMNVAAKKREQESLQHKREVADTLRQIQQVRDEAHEERGTEVSRQERLEEPREEGLSSDSQRNQVIDLSSCDELVVDYLEELQQAGMA